MDHGPTGSFRGESVAEFAIRNPGITLLSLLISGYILNLVLRK
jgi:hypothetical protein